MACMIPNLLGTGTIEWDDERGLISGQGENIYMLHLDSLNLVAYTPPAKTLQGLINGSSFAHTIALVGSSNAWTTIDAVGGTPATTSPVMQILDNYNLGAVQVVLEGHTGPIRSFNGVPYLDRNFTIKVENNPAGTANIALRLFFTNAEFAALQAADPSILNPADLAVVKQPNNTTTVPDAYTPITGEITITPTSWAAVDGGYYVEITVTSFSNFFIRKGAGTLPVTWLGLEAAWKDDANATVSWQVANQQDVQKYIVQHSLDGNVYTDACTVNASVLNSYSCLAPASTNSINDYRVLQVDLDGKKNYSKVVALQIIRTNALSIYPNPAKESITIMGLENSTELSISDESGKVIMRGAVMPGGNTVNIRQLSKGLYFLHLTNGKETQTIKFIKE
jgi:hypothetical protein